MASWFTRLTSAMRRHIDEVQVSAITGKVVRVEHENKKQEAAKRERKQGEKQ